MNNNKVIIRKEINLYGPALPIHYLFAVQEGYNPMNVCFYLHVLNCF